MGPLYSSTRPIYRRIQFSLLGLFGFATVAGALVGFVRFLARAYADKNIDPFAITMTLVTWASHCSRW